jgi:hypothetical protein
MHDDTLRPANVQESMELRFILMKHNITWSALFLDGEEWVIKYSKHAEHPDMNVLHNCPDLEVVRSEGFSGVLYVWVRLKKRG